jgi:hypothetical protein
MMQANLQASAQTLIPPKDANPLLSSMHEIATPTDIDWWPQTLGWQLLLLLAFAYLLYRLYLIIGKYISNAYRRAAMIELMSCSDKATDLEQVCKILRRTALYAFDRKQVAPLVGKDWEHWLDQQCKGTDFSGKHQGILSQLAYAPQASIESEKLAAFKSQVVFWVKNHRGNYGGGKYD